MLALLALFAPAAGAADPGSFAAELAGAEHALALGQPRLAEQAYRALLLDRPRSPLARAGLARALASLSRCDEALELLESIRETRAMDAAAALAGGRCLVIEGRPGQALEWYAFAVRREPNGPAGWYALAQTSGSVGDEAGVEAALDGLRLTAGAELEWLIRAEVAVRTGSADRDGWLAQAHQVLGPSAALAVLEARAWMDAGDPAAAEAVLREQLTRAPMNPQLALWRAEASRRLGDVDEAAAVYERTDLAGALDDPTALALVARILADQGDLDGAQRAIDALPDPLSAEGLASRWYLARGRSWETGRLRALWESVNPSQGRSLEQLVPVNSVAGPR